MYNFAILFLLLLITSCKLNKSQEVQFTVDEVPCSNQSSLELTNYVNDIISLKNDVYLVHYYTEISAIFKISAKRGNPKAMNEYPGLFFENRYFFKKDKSEYAFSNTERNGVIEALTYYYITKSAKGSNYKNEVEGLDTKYSWSFKPEWAEEAKQNANKYISKCTN
jgi:hypothetical protein